MLKPFWIWDIEEHNCEDIKTNGNLVIGLSPTLGNSNVSLSIFINANRTINIIGISEI
jgi:hypothetical protein